MHDETGQSILEALEHIALYAQTQLISRYGVSVRVSFKHSAACPACEVTRRANETAKPKEKA